MDKPCPRFEPGTLYNINIIKHQQTKACFDVYAYISLYINIVSIKKKIMTLIFANN